MTVNYFPQDDPIGAASWRPIPALDADILLPAEPAGQVKSVDVITISAILLLLFLGLRLVLDRSQAAEASRDAPPVAHIAQDEVDLSESPAVPPVSADPAAIAYPYDNYVLTQGPHGYSYGHMAIDIAAGKGAAVKSPIQGAVTALYLDEYGNPTLVIENEVYQVTMLHGDFSVAVGQQVKLGQQVGTESNRGYTLDWQGQYCGNRDCGYHTHLNVFDKRVGSNVNPLTVLN